MSSRDTRSEVTDLVEKLMLEYAGALPPGQVLAIVHRTHRSLTRDLRGHLDVTILETVVRSALTGRLASLGQEHVHAHAAG